MKQKQRGGFTIIEVLVTISIIGLLLALAIPAVMQIRESSRRMQCLANLSNFGKALQNHESVHQKFPPAMPATRTRPTLGSDRLYSVHAHLLSFLEQNPLADKIQLNKQQFSYFDPREMSNAKIAMAPIEVFLCPSDSRMSGNNYRVNLGPDPYFFKSFGRLHAAEGAFSALLEHRTQDFTDGLSYTVAMSEKIKGGGDINQFTKHDFWYTGLSNIGANLPRDELIDVCNSLTEDPADFHPYSGWTWYLSTYAYSWYNHTVGPNASVPDCTTYAFTGDSVPAGPGIYKASSFHSGGVNCLFMDGSVRFIADEINLNVWRALSTRAGAEHSEASAF